MSIKTLDALILKHKASFSQTDNKIADYFLEINDEVVNKTLASLSYEIGVSEASIFNFVKKLGFNGFQAFKISIASSMDNERSPDNNLTNFSNISKDDSSLLIAQKVLASTEKALSNLLLYVEEKDLDHSLELIKGSKTLHFFGQGASTILALDSYHKFHRSHYRCNYIMNSHMQLSYATKLDSSDCAFLFSHSGQSIETIQIGRILKENGVKLITLTGNPRSELVELSDVSFVIYSEEAIFRSESLTAKILYQTLIDIIFVNVMYDDEQKNTASLDKIRKAISLTRKQ